MVKLKVERLHQREAQQVVGDKEEHIGTEQGEHAIVG